MDDKDIIDALQERYQNSPEPDEHTWLLQYAGAAKPSELRAVAQRDPMGDAMLAQLNPPRSIGRPWVAVAAVAAVLVIVGVGIRLSSLQDNTHGLRSMGSDATGADAISVAVRRADRDGRALSGQVFYTGDELTLFYSSSRAGFVSMWGRDGSGDVVALDEAQGSRAIAPGTNIALPGSIRLTSGTACEWVVAVFSNTLLNTSLVRAAIANAVEDSACELQLNVPGARHVSTFVLRRNTKTRQEP